MNPLQVLNAIPKYGQHLYNGQHYSIKYCMKQTEQIVEKLKELKRLYPELIVYYAKTGRVLFGGTFPRTSNFAHDKQRLLGLK